MMSPLHRLQCIVQSLYSALSASTPTSTLAPFPLFFFSSFSVSDRAPFPSLSSSFCSISSPFYAVVPFSSFFAAPRPQTHSETEIVRMHSQSHCHGAFAFFSTICPLDTVAFGIWIDHDQSRCLYPSAGAWTFDDDDIRRLEHEWRIIGIRRTEYALDLVVSIRLKQESNTFEYGTDIMDQHGDCLLDSDPDDMLFLKR